MKRNGFIKCLFSIAVLSAVLMVGPVSKASIVYAEEGQKADAVTAEETKDNATEAAQENSEEQTEKTPEELAKEAEEARLALQNDPNHVHHFEWVAFMNESESAEGTIDYICLECGKVWYFRPIPAYYAFQGDVARRIKTAPEGATVRVVTSMYINFNYQVMEALAKRPDVSVYVSFLDQEYKGNRVSFVIPAGEDDIDLLDENGYAGFIYLGNKYGLTLEVPMEVSSPSDGENDSASAEKNSGAEDALSKEVKHSASVLPESFRKHRNA